MRFVILLSLVASASFGQGRFDRFNQRTDQGRSHRGFEQSGSKTEFCAVAATYLTGSSWCLQGNGAMRAGASRTLVAVNGPTTVTSGGRIAQNLVRASAQGYGESSNSVFTAPAAYTVCALVSFNDFTSNQTAVSMANGIVSTNRNWELYANTSSQAVFVAADAAGATSCLSFTGGLVAGTPTLLCGVHDGSNATVYRNTTAASSAACTGILSGVSQRAGAGMLWQGAAWQTHLNGIYFGGFYTEQALSPAQISALYGALQ
jgi:hypothetical protein